MKYLFTFLFTLTTFLTYSQCGFTIDVTVFSPECAPSNWGIAYFDVTGGTPPYSYVVDTTSTFNSDTTQSAQPMSIGCHEVTIRDATGCAEVDTICINPPATSVEIVNVSMSPAVICQGDSTLVELTIVGATAPNYILWSNGTEGASGNPVYLSGGTWWITTSDANGCGVSETIIVEEDSSCLVILGGYVINDDINPDCMDDADTTRLENITVRLDNGSEVFTDANGYYEFILPTGTYNVEVVTNQYYVLCPVSNMLTVSLPNNGMMSVGNNFYLESTPCDFVINTSVNGPPDECYNNYGWIDVDVSGGVAPYSYSWDSLNTPWWAGLDTIEPIQQQLLPGCYELTVTDATGCAEVTTACIEADTIMPIEIDLEISPPVVCPGDSALVELAITGGTAPYTIIWNGGLGSANPIYLAGGYSYYTTITDINGCLDIYSFDVEEQNFEVSTTTTSCNAADGTAEVTGITSTSSNLAYAWSSGGTGQVETGLAEGGYTVSVTDLDVGCTVEQTFNIEEDSSCLVTLGGYVINDDINPDCMDDADTTRLENITVRLDNGAEVLTDANGYYEFILPTGTYDVEVITNQYYVLCPASNLLTVTLPNQGMMSVGNNFYLESTPCDFVVDINTQDPECGGDSVGWINVNTTGGTPPYSYLLDSVPTTFSPNPGAWSSLNIGCHELIAMDATNCTEIFTVCIDTALVDELEVIDINISPPVVCPGNSALVELIIAGGTAPYNVDWGGWVTGNPTSLSSGYTYYVTVSDANWCTTYLPLTIENQNFELSITDASCNAADGTAEVVGITSASSNLAYAWSSGGTGQIETGLAEGGYVVSVTDLDIGCTVEQTFYIEEDLSCKVIISGYVINDDVNPDCLNDADTLNVENMMVMLDNGLATYTDASGYYEFILDPGVYELELITGQYNILCPASGTLTINLPNPGMVSDGNDFYLEYANYQDICVSAYIAGFSPTFDLLFSIFEVCNIGGVTVNNGTVTFVPDSLFEDIDFGLPPDIYNPVTLAAEWNYTVLEPNECFTIGMVGYLPEDTPFGTVICNSIIANPIITDDNPTNNTYDWCEEITAPYDPNDKRGFVGTASQWGGDILETDILFNYNLRFQNVGNDTAHTVVVKDTLDLAVFDIESIQPGPSSHPYVLEFEDNNVLVFRFEDIDLVDSLTNEAESHGFTSFMINRFPNLPIGTEIKNSAAIFFDFNAPVITNTTIHTISNPLSIAEPELDIDANIYPNPITDETVVSYQLDKAETVSISVIDQLGRTCFTLLENERQIAGYHTLALSGEGLTSGVYLLQITTADGQVSKKFVR